jgi:hypothetical protein
MRRRPVAATAASLALILSLLPSTAIPVLAACGKEEATASFTPAYASDGAKMTWKARALVATDTGSRGFSAEVMWVGTDNAIASDVWVETGVTQGWQGQNIYTEYTAHGDFRHSPPIYAEHKWPDATIGTAYTFAGFHNTTTTYRVTVNPTGSVWDWNGHNGPTSHFAGGSESTCGSTGKVTKTFVSASYARRTSDHAYLIANSAGLVDLSPNGGVAWCHTGFDFRYWLNDANNSGCS